MLPYRHGSPIRTTFAHQYDKKEGYCGRSGFRGISGTPRLPGSSAAAISSMIFPEPDAPRDAWLRSRISKMDCQAVRRLMAPAGVKGVNGWLRVSMYQIASVSLRARSI